MKEVPQRDREIFPGNILSTKPEPGPINMLYGAICMPKLYTLPDIHISNRNDARFISKWGANFAAEDVKWEQYVVF